MHGLKVSLLNQSVVTNMHLVFEKLNNAKESYACYCIYLFFPKKKILSYVSHCCFPLLSVFSYAFSELHIEIRDPNFFLNHEMPGFPGLTTGISGLFFSFNSNDVNK